MSRDTNDFQKAMDYLRTTVEMDPERANRLYELASLLVSQERYDEAWVYAQRSVTLAPDEPDYLVLAGKNLRFWEVEIPAHSVYANRSLKEIRIREETSSVNSTRTWSPTGCPCVSFTSLK